MIWDEAIGEKELFYVNCDDGLHDLADISWKEANRSVVKGIGFVPFNLCNAVMFADFQADGRWPRANYRVKNAERGCARAAERVFITCELMPFGPVAESESRVARNLSIFSWKRHKVQEQLGATGFSNDRLRSPSLWQVLEDSFAMWKCYIWVCIFVIVIVNVTAVYVLYEWCIRASHVMEQRTRWDCATCPVNLVFPLHHLPYWAGRMPLRYAHSSLSCLAWVLMST